MIRFYINIFAFILLFYSFGSCFTESNYKNTISISGGVMEIIDLEYQYSINPFYFAIKPGFIVMLGYYSHVHGWPAYPSVRFGMDLYKFKSIKIGPQLECAYFYSSPVEYDYLYSKHADKHDYFAVGNYSKKWKTDHLLFSLGPAIRYFHKRLELQGCIGIQLDNSIEFIDEVTGTVKSKNVKISDTRLYPLLRISAGVLF